ncbi:MAG TPA: hypothetical protein VLC12_04360 [Terriglobales bacterium]|nr:hypothetical protein [Terriglobales bacterium]
MLLTALRAPVGALAASGQPMAGSSVNHAKQPCLDSPAFDWTVPRSGLNLVFQPRETSHALVSSSVAYIPGTREFRLYNRPPPLS